MNSCLICSRLSIAIGFPFIIKLVSSSLICSYDGFESGQDFKPGDRMAWNLDKELLLERIFSDSFEAVHCHPSSG